MHDFTRNSFKYIQVNGKEVTLTQLHQRVRPEECTEEQLAEALRPKFAEHIVRDRIGGQTLISNGKELALVNDKVLGLLQAQQ